METSFSFNVIFVDFQSHSNIDEMTAGIIELITDGNSELVAQV